MMFQNCPNEKEVRELIESGQWPLAAAPELRAHVSECRACGDLAFVAEAFKQARAETLAAARLASPGVLLWRAQLRRRNAAVERLTRPLLGAQIFALAVTLLAGVGFAGFEARHGVAWFSLASAASARRGTRLGQPALRFARRLRMDLDGALPRPRHPGAPRWCRCLHGHGQAITNGPIRSRPSRRRRKLTAFPYAIPGI